MKYGKPLKESNKERPYRKGMTYNKAYVSTPITHKSEYSMLPEGSVAIQVLQSDGYNVYMYLDNELIEHFCCLAHARDKFKYAYNQECFWAQIFAYRNDGEYSIDNMAAERTIRPITIQRKNRLFFGCVKGIQNSVIYNIFIETCKQEGISYRDYFCRLLRELKKGRTDYETFLSMIICK